jgi:uncharacterized membrane protein
MTDDTDDATDPTDDEPTDRQPASRSRTNATPDRGRRATRGPASRGRDVIDYVYWGGLIVCSILALVALFHFYTNATQAISLWVESKYEPIVQSMFALAVLLAGLIGVSLTVRELSPSGSE